MKKSRVLAVVSFGAIGVVCYAWLRSGSEEPRGDEALIVDRVWIDSKPAKYTDYANRLLFVGGSTTGIVDRSSAYDFHMQLVEYARDGGALKLVFPQTGKQAGVAFTIRACSDLPPFDLCLDLDASPWDGPKRYYGIREREDEAGELGPIRRRIEREIEAPR